MIHWRRVIGSRVSRRGRLLSLAFVSSVCAAVCFLSLDAWRTDGVLPGCVFHSVTGLFCPGCGSVRSIRSLLELDFRQAWAFNPLLVVLVPYLGFWMLQHLVRGLFGRDLTLARVPAWCGGVLLLLVVFFFLARNLPLAACDSLRPHQIRGD